MSTLDIEQLADLAEEFSSVFHVPEALRGQTTHKVTVIC